MEKKNFIGQIHNSMYQNIKKKGWVAPVDVLPKDMPPPDYHSMMRELYGIGNNMNQIAQKSYVLNVIDVQRYDENYRQLCDAILRIEQAVCMPEKV